MSTTIKAKLTRYIYNINGNKKIKDKRGIWSKFMSTAIKTRLTGYIDNINGNKI